MVSSTSLVDQPIVDHAHRLVAAHAAGTADGVDLVEDHEVELLLRVRVRVRVRHRDRDRDRDRVRSRGGAPRHR